MGRGTGGEGVRHVTPVFLPYHPRRGWQGGVVGAWQAGKADGEERRGKHRAAKINSGRYKHPASCTV